MSINELCLENSWAETSRRLEETLVEKLVEKLVGLFSQVQM